MFYQQDERTLKFAQYILENRTTIRATASHFGIAKSTVHHDLSTKLKALDKHLYAQVKALLEENFKVKHLHGGESTKYKYLKLKNHVDKFEETEALSLI